MSGALRDLGHGIHLVQLPLPFPRLPATNAYIISSPEGITLIDCGVGSEEGYGALVRALDDLGPGLPGLTTVVATHLHVDHAGLAGRLVAETDCQLIMHAAAVDGIEAYNDWTIAQVAAGRGDVASRDLFAARAQSYRNLWDPSVGFMRGRWRNGTWVEPFDPARLPPGNDFTEATSWIYSWFVPHDVPGLIELVGGSQAMVDKLDQFFAGGYFDVSNEPSFHVPFLYNYAGAPAKTQERVRAILAESFAAEPGGLPGNDDAGATSAWYVLAALGLYPVAPGDGVYQITSPLFDRATLQLNPAVYGGGTLVIEAVRSSPGDIYIQSVSWEGRDLTRPEIRHDELVRGGTLRIVLGPAPSAWGTGPL